MWPEASAKCPGHPLWAVKELAGESNAAILVFGRNQIYGSGKTKSNKWPFGGLVKLSAGVALRRCRTTSLIRKSKVSILEQAKGGGSGCADRAEESWKCGTGGRVGLWTYPLRMQLLSPCFK